MKSNSINPTLQKLNKKFEIIKKFEDAGLLKIYIHTRKVFFNLTLWQGKTQSFKTEWCNSIYYYFIAVDPNLKHKGIFFYNIETENLVAQLQNDTVIFS